MRTPTAAPFTDHRTGDPPRAGDGRRRLAVVIAALLAALLVLSLGIALGRSSVSAPTSKPSEGREGDPIDSSGPGPRSAVHGVGVGWAHSQPGAVGAATAYTIGVNGRAFVGDVDTRREILQAVLPPDELRDIESLVGSASTPPAGSPLSAAHADEQSSAYRYVPVGYKLESFSAEAAVVTVWGFSLYAGTGSANVAASTAWATARVPLTWSGGDWKLEASAVTQEPGPTPAVSGELSSDLSIIATDRGFASYAYATR
ncbi:MAG: hypothetical protein ACRDWY_15755 [Actinomycetes bacterium]